VSKAEEVINWVRSFKSGNRWLNSVLASGNASEGTQRLYASNLKLYCELVGKNPDELIQERFKQLKSDYELEKFAAEEQLQAVFIKLRNQFPGKAKNLLIAVRSFYKHNRCPLQLQMPKFIHEPWKPVTLEDLRKVYEHSDAQVKVYIAILKDTGMSRDDAVRLRYKDIKADFEAGKEFITLYVVRKKEAVRYNTFLGPDSVKALKLWFEYLQNKGKKITDETPLLTTRNLRPVLPDYVTLTLLRAGRKIGKHIIPHGIRKLFETNLALRGIHPMILKHWMGHKLPDIESRYILPPVEAQLRLYMENYDAISILETIRKEKEKANLIEQLLMELGFDEKAARIVRKYNLTRSLSVGEIVGLLQQLRTE